MATLDRYPGLSSGPRRVFIAGCGRTGAAIATELCSEGSRVQIIDVAPNAFDHLAPYLVESGQVEPLLGDATLESNLRRVSAQDADVFIAVAGPDAVNITSAQIALHILRVPKVICRLDDPVKRELYEELELTTVSHTHLVKNVVMQLMQDSDDVSVAG